MNPPAPNTSIVLPNATSLRWQPVRGGLINLYRYDYQEFRYENGRLVLRGNNGTGKSRVLALQLPFLLDGEIIPQRFEPDGDPAKRMEWNLLMGGRYDDRQGYTWLEFGRIDENGQEHFQTIGCGLRAVQGKGIAQQWMFITRQRIGRDLFLLNESSQPLSKTKLEDSIADQGKVFGSGKIEEDRRDYRKAVDMAFFQLGSRYGSLLSLLIQLRQPQLTRKLEEKTLSDALNQSLPPLPESVLGDVADAFRSLENDRQELSDLIAARDGSEVFLVEYQRYIRIAARRRAEEVRKANSAYEATMRRLRELQGEKHENEEHLKTAGDHIDWLKGEKASADARLQTLQESPEMKSARELATARETASRAQSRAEDAERELDSRAATLAKEGERHASTIEQDRRAKQELSLSETNSEALAQTCGLAGHHRESRSAPDAGDARLKEHIAQHLKSALHIERRNQAISEAWQKVTIAQSNHNQASTELEEHLEHERAAIDARDVAITTLFQAYRDWAAGLRELEPTSLDTFEDEFIQWSETAEAESPLASAVKLAEQTAVSRLSRLHGDAQRALDEERRNLTEQESECQRLRDGREQPPPIPHTRNPDAREDRPGAPFWALCDFRPEITDDQKAGLEAAMEAAGLLDAWVTLDGEVIHPHQHDSFLSSRTNSPAPVGRSLDRFLKPDPLRKTPVVDAVIVGVLQQIGCDQDAGQAWVTTEGRWQLGPLHGSWSKPSAQYIGHASREAERQRRLREVEEQMLETQTRITAHDENISSIVSRQNAARGEADAAPTDGTVRGRVADIASAHRAVAAKRSRLAETESRLQKDRQLHLDSVALRNQEAADLSIGAWVERLTELREMLGEYRQSLTERRAAIDKQQSTSDQVAWAEDSLAKARQLSEQSEIRQRDAHQELLAAQSNLETLEESAGASAEAIMAKLEDAKLNQRKIADALEEHEKKKNGIATAIAIAESRIVETNSNLTEKSQARDVAITALIGFAETGQLRVAHHDLGGLTSGPWSSSRGVEIARQIDSLLSNVDYDDVAWRRNQSNIHQHFDTLQSSLRSHGYMPEGTLLNDVYVVSIPFQGKVCTIDELRDALIDIIRDRQELLDAREREVLENYLIDEVAESLHDLLHSALRWKEEANRELESRPMDTGMTLRFSWEPSADSPPALTEARKLLLGARGTWSPAERKAVGDFLQQQIRAVRAANDTGTWQDHLTLAFDYRKWHHFGVERKQDGAWKRLTKRTHGTGSGGEKAVALTVPQLAAAAAHYRSAHPLAPRLILLDEAFVGVDADMREKCFGMIAAFDLDVVITSENEWACYPTVPSIAIYQLSARPGIDAVYASRWVWNGRKRLRDETPDPSPLPPGASA
ncbi:TIGR02680 family protein [Luteolibacter ambystomatis]|uniref:TIGR02680 family protein n=1 Tax=Luteolibacter ambystomatis TaxID=2824561 RepID=A0A975PGE4_9BACT|nr:TIGR02680 family protein [Luteolibacter ambystomatis]QUE52227.1 TIGR02680 family protein [Luteolibacter ambystomatis]